MNRIAYEDAAEAIAVAKSAHGRRRAAALLDAYYAISPSHAPTRLRIALLREALERELDTQR